MVENILLRKEEAGSKNKEEKKDIKQSIVNIITKMYGAVQCRIITAVSAALTS